MSTVLYVDLWMTFVIFVHYMKQWPSCSAVSFVVQTQRVDSQPHLDQRQTSQELVTLQPSLRHTNTKMAHVFVWKSMSFT